MAVLPFTLPYAAEWPKVWGPQVECCPVSFEVHYTAVLYRDSGTVLPKGGWFFKIDTRDSEANASRCAHYAGTCFEECINFYSIESVEKFQENDADGSKTKFWVHWPVE